MDVQNYQRGSVTCSAPMWLNALVSGSYMRADGASENRSVYPQNSFAKRGLYGRYASICNNLNSGGALVSGALSNMHALIAGDLISQPRVLNSEAGASGIRLLKSKPKQNIPLNEHRMSWSFQPRMPPEI